MSVGTVFMGELLQASCDIQTGLVKRDAVCVFGGGVDTDGWGWRQWYIRGRSREPWGHRPCPPLFCPLQARIHPRTPTDAMPIDATPSGVTPPNAMPTDLTQADARPTDTLQKGLGVASKCTRYTAARLLMNPAFLSATCAHQELLLSM